MFAMEASVASLQALLEEIQAVTLSVPAGSPADPLTPDANCWKALLESCRALQFPLRQPARYYRGCRG
jgi:hypothetical protein